MSNRKPSRKSRTSKYDELISIPNATAEEIAQTMFMGKPKPKDEWRYLKRRKANT
ncbi:MAG: hypothetical protein OXT71_17195 [Acidobacteriota bacterium]|nr:hypothetical protein [Acidobacteriota bacterium]